MLEIISHLLGDYVFQSHNMATKKTSESYWCLYHAIWYTVPFLSITHSLIALSIIGVTHFAIDRFKLAVLITKLKNYFLGSFDSDVWKSKNGYPDETPIWLSTWLVIILDNTLHITINHLTIIYFR
jgi:hypothetical protein